MAQRSAYNAKTAGKPVFRIVLDEVIVMGPAKADLLDAVVETGSITSAARHIGMSYRRAWNLIDALNHSFREPLVKMTIGGPRGGGCELTVHGQAVLASYRAMERRALGAVRAEMQRFTDYLKPGVAARKSSSRATQNS